MFSDCDFSKGVVRVSTAFGVERGPFRTEEELHDKTQHVFLGYFGANKYVRHISSLCSALLWVFRNVRQGDVVCVYNFPITYALPLLAKKIFTKYQLLVSFEDFFNKSDIRYYLVHPFEVLAMVYSTGFIASSPGLAEYISKYNSKSHILINGGYEADVSHIAGKSIRRNAKTVSLLYSGSLDKPRGILDLLSYFSSNTNSKYRLTVTGDGPLSGEVEAFSRRDARVKYLGSLNNNDYLMELKEADICINPQWEEITTNFPSKITMYLSFGKCVLSTRHDALLLSPYNELIDYYNHSSEEFWLGIENILANKPLGVEPENERKLMFKHVSERVRKEFVEHINSNYV